jgi:recombination protein RecT
MEEGADEVPVLDAATVIVLRDGENGPEVLMMLRNVNSDFVGGAYLFPGGAVDATDGDDAHRRRAFTVGTAREFVPRVAGVRETFEEAGVLLAVDADGKWADAATMPNWDELRTAVDRSDRTIASVCEEHDLLMAVDRLLPFARWVTPHGAPRRYDTRFYLVAHPSGQVATADDRELVNVIWVRPQDALRRYQNHEMSLIFPTARSLMELASFESVEAIMADYAERSEPEPIEPTLEIFGERHHVILPDGTRFDGDTALPV